MGFFLQKYINVLVYGVKTYFYINTYLFKLPILYKYQNAYLKCLVLILSLKKITFQKYYYFYKEYTNPLYVCLYYISFEITF